MMKKDSVAFLGPLGTYSHQVTSNYFGDNVVLVPVDRIQNVFEAVTESRADYGIVPIENSNFGKVLETMKELRITELVIRDLINFQVSHALLSSSKTLSSIKTIYSHVQGLGQCSNYLDKHYPSAERIQCDSTASAALQCQKDEFSLAICSIKCASVYGLHVVDESIQDDGATNTTRFVVLSLSSKKLDSLYPV